MKRRRRRNASAFGWKQATLEAYATAEAARRVARAMARASGRRYRIKKFNRAGNHLDITTGGLRWMPFFWIVEGYFG